MEFDIKRLVRLIQQQASVHPGLCFIVAITGIPGSGKTTVAKSIVRELSRTANTKAGLISMDGFHLTREELSRLQTRKKLMPVVVRRGLLTPTV